MQGLAWPSAGLDHCSMLAWQCLCAVGVVAVMTDEIVYSETRPGVMETDREKYAREERVYRRWDKAGPWILPAGFGFLILCQVVREWLG